MIELLELQVKQSNGFRLLNIDNSIDLTTATEPYDRYPSNNNGGVVIRPSLKIENVVDGKVFFTQIAVYHKLSIFTDKGGEYLYENPCTLKDTVFTYEQYYGSSYPIKNNILSIQPEFYDAPFQELLPFYIHVEYDLHFQTWLQYQSSVDCKYPILSFDWCLSTIADKVKSWKIIKNEFWNSKEIADSLRRKTSSDSFLEITDMPHLSSQVREFKTKIFNDYKTTR